MFDTNSNRGYARTKQGETSFVCPTRDNFNDIFGDTPLILIVAWCYVAYNLARKIAYSTIKKNQLEQAVTQICFIAFIVDFKIKF